MYGVPAPEGCHPVKHRFIHVKVETLPAGHDRTDSPTRQWRRGGNPTDEACSMTIPASPVSAYARRLLTALAVFLCAAMGVSAWADPPGRVGSLGELDGQVWFYSPDAGEWVSAVRNQPLTTGDRLSTDTAARAELRIGSSTVRLDGGTEVEVLKIDDEHIALQLHGGSIAARLRDDESAREFELTTVEGRFLVHRAGRYRFDRADDSSHVTVREGEALYEGPGSALTVAAGQRAEFWLEADHTAQYSITDPVNDAFAAWSGERDLQDDRSASTRYVSPEMTGVQDLDRYGRWEQASDYGAVWVPSQVPPGWAPYSAGHWAWVGPWGWTWVDDAPWGFAPFHYGRWAMWQNRWCWVPGIYARRPVYAPALVGWVGGAGLSIGVSSGGHAGRPVGWFPLAPHEVYVPTYRVSPHYVRRVNGPHVRHIDNVDTIVDNPQLAVSRIDFRNRRFPHATTVVPQAALANRRPIGPVAAQYRNDDAVQRLQHGQKNMLPAAPVGAPRPGDVRRYIHGKPPARPEVSNRLSTSTVAPSRPQRPEQPLRPERPERPAPGAAPRSPMATTVPSRVAPVAPVARPPTPAPVGRATPDAPPGFAPARAAPPSRMHSRDTPSRRDSEVPAPSQRPPQQAQRMAPQTPARVQPQPPRMPQVRPPSPSPPPRAAPDPRPGGEARGFAPAENRRGHRESHGRSEHHRQPRAR
jgi:hypothetical protein